MSSSATLNLSNYTTVWSDNFANDTQLNSGLWPISWGNSNDFSFANGALTLTSYASEGWSAVGFMQADFGATSGQGYGLYSATFSLNAGEGVGIAVLMWPANNVWPGPEIDLAEDWSDPTRQTGNATIHWAGAGDTNQYQTYQFSANMTQPTQVAMDWEPGSLTFYVNGVEVFQYTGPNVPKDAAQGGVNESFGAEVTAAGGAPVSNSVSLHLYSMSYATYNGGTSSQGGGTTPPPATGGGGGTGSGTGTGGAGGSTITLSAPGTVQQASAGAGAVVTETVSAPGLSTIYEAVFTSSNVAEGNWQAVSLNASGQGSFSATFENSGDYIVAVNNPNNPTVKGWSAPITLTTAPAGTGGGGGTTPPPATGGGGGTGSGTGTGGAGGSTITLSAPGTVQQASAGAGAVVTETVSAPGLSTIYEAVFTSSNVAEGNWQAVSLNASGQGSFSATFENSGDYIVAVNNPNNPTVKGWSAPITLTTAPAGTGGGGGTTPPPATGGGGGTGSGTGTGGAGGSTITLSAPGTVQQASAGAGAVVTETVSAPGLSTIYEAVFTSSNVAEGNWQAVSLNASGQGSFSATFENSGDYIVAVNNPNNPTVKGWSAPITLTTAPAGTGGGGGTTPPPATGGGGGTGSGTGTGGAGGSTITLSAPGTVQQASAGAGAVVTETVSAPGLSTIYEAVFTSSNVAEGNWQAVSLNASGQGSFSATFENSGDYIVAVNNPNNPTVKGWSAPITLTTAPAGTGGGGGTTPPPATGGGGGTGSGTGTGGAGGSTITLSAPGTVQQASAGAGAVVTETVSAPGLSTIYEAVFTSSNVAEGNWQAVSLNASGQGSFSATFENSGDYIVAVNNPNNPTVKGWSAPITLTTAPAGTGGGGGTTPPPATGGGGGTGSGTGTGGAGGSTITLSAPGTVQQASAGAGAVVTETVSAPGLSTIYEAVFTSSNVAEGNWQAVSLNASGQGSFSATFENSGDYIVAVNNPNNPTVKGWSAPITLTTAPAGTGGGGGTTPPPATGGGGGTGSAGAAEVTVADSVGRIVSLPLATGTQTFAPSATQLSGPVTETTANGVTDLSTPSGSGVVGLDIEDSTGGSYQADGFATVQATLSGATDGSLSVNAAQNSYITLGSGNYTVRVASLINSATVQATAGSGSDRMTFIGSGTASFVCGSGNDTIVGGQGGNSVTFGAGSADVWGGTGADTYIFQAGDGMQTVETFDAAKGDVLDIATALKASLQESSAGGSTLLSFGGSGHGILLQGVASFDTSQIHWT